MITDNLTEESGHKGNTIWPWIVTILIGAWLIGMSIIVAGLLISKQIAKNNPVIEEPFVENSEPINIEVPAGLPVLGNNNAKVTVIEFADFQCPYCGDWQKTVFPELKKNYIDTGKIRFVFMDYAFLGKESYRAAEAARCAHDQNKFWEYHDKIFASQNSENEGAFSDPNLKQFAKDVGLNQSEFNTCLDANKYQKDVENALVTGDSYGITSTPTLFINGYKHEGLYPFSHYQDAIESELAK